MFENIRNATLTDIGQLLAIKPFGTAVSLGQILSVALLVLVGYLGSRLSVFLLHRRLANGRLRPDAIHALSKVVFWLILVIVAVTALGLLNIPLTAFAFVTGAIAIGVGFGAQNIINNFISGWILMAEKPIRIDDFIEIDGMQGIVEGIGNRSTRIRRSDGVHLLVPNSSLLEKLVINWTLVDRHIRTSVRVGVAYGSPVKLVAQLIEQAVTEQDESREQPPPSVIFEDFGDSALIFDAYLWCDVSGERGLRTVRSRIRFRIVELFAEHNIVIAFPQLDVHLAAASPMTLNIEPHAGDQP